MNANKGQQLIQPDNAEEIGEAGEKVKADPVLNKVSPSVPNRQFRTQEMGNRDVVPQKAVC